MRRIVLLLVTVFLAGCLDEDNPIPADSDGDGWSDADEVEAGTDPRNATSVPVPDEPDRVDVWPEWGSLETALLRPGASLGGYCTFNFLFEGPDGTGYVGTAAHCTETGDIVELAGFGPIGTVVYDSDDVSSTVDFSLIELDEPILMLAHPRMLAWEGPTGSITVDDLSIGDQIQLYGYGMVLGEQEETRPRFGFLVDWTDDEYNVDMPAVNGDSGAPLLQEGGKAFGIVSRYGFDNTPPSTDRGPIMPYIWRALEAAGFGDVRLATI